MSWLSTGLKYVLAGTQSAHYAMAHGRRKTTSIENRDFDIVTVVCFRDLSLLRLQARSLALYLDLTFSGSILLVVNDLQQSKVIEIIRDEILPSYGRWRSRVKIIPYYHLGYGLDPSNGWKIQQALKLAVAFTVGRAFYVILDSKNHLVRSVRVRDFVTEHGFARQKLHADESTLDVHSQACARFLGLRPEDVEPCWPMTPFVFHTQTARDLVVRIERQEGRSIFSTFRRVRFLSEFLLYKAHLRSAETEGYVSPYEAGPLLCRTVWPGQCVASAIADAEGNPGLLVFGVHRDVIGNLTVEDRSKLHRFWRRCGLIDPAVLASDEQDASFFKDHRTFRKPRFAFRSAA